MYCPNCGTEVEEAAVFCSNCGQNLTQQPVENSPAETPLAPQHPMGWFKFLINFGLWAGAFVNIVLNGIPLLTGSIYGDTETAELVYATFAGMKGLDMLCGVLAIAIGIFGIYTRFQLAGYKVNGPKLLTYVYIGAVVFNLVYVIGCNVVLPEYTLKTLDFTSFYSGSITSAVMIFVNQSYFKKREALFIN